MWGYGQKTKGTKLIFMYMNRRTIVNLDWGELLTPRNHSSYASAASTISFRPLRPPSARPLPSVRNGKSNDDGRRRSPRLSVYSDGGGRPQWWHSMIVAHYTRFIWWRWWAGIGCRTETKQKEIWAEFIRWIVCSFCRYSSENANKQHILRLKRNHKILKIILSLPANKQKDI